jgi:hypothetical protein
MDPRAAFGAIASVGDVFLCAEPFPVSEGGRQFSTNGRASAGLPTALRERLALLLGEFFGLSEADVVAQGFGLLLVWHFRQKEDALVVAVLGRCCEVGELLFCPCPGEGWLVL